MNSMHKAGFSTDKRHYHLIGIGGTAMGSLAGLLRAAGHEVTGSDENVYPPMSDQLKQLTPLLKVRAQELERQSVTVVLTPGKEPKVEVQGEPSDEQR